MPSQKMEYFFPPNSSGHLRLYVHQSQIIGADVDHTQTIGGIQSNYCLIVGDISPPPGFGTPGCNNQFAYDFVFSIVSSVRIPCLIKHA